MRYTRALVAVSFVLILVSCKKEHGPLPGEPPVGAPKHILLKDIIIPHLPSPFYHFEYNSDSLVNKVDFSSGFTIYDVIYSGDRIAEMRNNIFVNHDTLRYSYDQAGRVTLIKFINDENVVFRRVLFTYSGNQIQQIEWDHMTASGDFLIDRKVSFAFFPDGNLKTMTDHRLFPAGTPEHSYITTFEQYDNKINVDDFSLVHDGIHDHLFLLQGFRLQKNNPGKETFSVDGVTFYTESYTYTSNGDNTPSTKIGDFVYASGPDAGKRFETSTFYTYY